MIGQSKVRGYATPKRQYSELDVDDVECYEIAHQVQFAEMRLTSLSN